MSRPRQYDNRTTTAIRFPAELHERLQHEAEVRELSMNWLVNRAVERFLDDLIPVEEFVLTRSEQTRHNSHTAGDPPNRQEQP